MNSCRNPTNMVASLYKKITFVAVKYLIIVFIFFIFNDILTVMRTKNHQNHLVVLYVLPNHEGD